MMIPHPTQLGEALEVTYCLRRGLLMRTCPIGYKLIMKFLTVCMTPNELEKHAPD